MSLNEHNLPGQLVLAEGSIERAISEGEAVTELRHNPRPEDSVRSLYRNPFGVLTTHSGSRVFFRPERIPPTRGPVPDLQDPEDMPQALMRELAKLDAAGYLRLAAEDTFLQLQQRHLVDRINIVADSGLKLSQRNGVWGWWAPEDFNDEV